MFFLYLEKIHKESFILLTGRVTERDRPSVGTLPKWPQGPGKDRLTSGARSFLKFFEMILGPQALRPSSTSL